MRDNSVARRYPYIMLLACSLLLAFSAGLPLWAQDSTGFLDEPGTTIVVAGTVTFGPAGEIMVGEYVIAPASAFVPAGLIEGDVVIIVGVLLPDGVTVRALEFEYFDGSNSEEPEVTPEPTDVPEETPEPEPTDEPEVTPEPEAGAFCGNPYHPVVASIADRFGTTYDEVMALHCAGQGIGNIIRAYLLAETLGKTAQDYLADARAQGWGSVIRDSGLHPGTLAAGLALRNKPSDDSETASTSSSAAARSSAPGNSGNNPGGGRPDNLGGGRPDNPGGGRPDNNPGGGRPDNPGGGNSGRGGKP